MFGFHRPWRQTPIGLLFVVLVATPSAAIWYNENIEDGSDIVMMDLRWPWWPSGTYFANWNTGFNPKPNNLSFYAGIQSHLPVAAASPDGLSAELQANYRPGNTWSLWGNSAVGNRPRFVDVGPTLSMVNAYGGEGTSAYLAALPWPFVRSERWYTMLGRVWRPAPDADYAYCGRWIKDHADGHWHLIGIARLPIAAASFHGNSGFIEPLGKPGEVRSLHRRLGYMRKDGVWKKADRITIENTSYAAVSVLPEGEHEYIAIEYAQRPELLPRKLVGPVLDGNRRYDFQTRQPDRPNLDKPQAISAQATATAEQIAVSWEVPASASPMLGYRIEVYDNPQCKGLPKIVQEDLLPSVRQVLLAHSLPSPTVKLTIIDVFDQQSEPLVVMPKPAEFQSPNSAKVELVTGLSYRLYHQDAQRQVNFWQDYKVDPQERHHWLSLEELAQGRLVRQGQARGFDRSILEGRRKGYAIEYAGWLRVPRTGLYLLRARIDGAYRLKINSQEVLCRDGQYGATEKTVLASLSAGDQRFELTHLFDEFPGLPDANFELEWEGPDKAREPIPLEAICSERDHGTPVVKLEGRLQEDGSARVSVQVSLSQPEPIHTRLYLGDLELARAANTQLEYVGSLPEGTNQLWARVVHNGNRTVDSELVELEVGRTNLAAPWTLRNAGDEAESVGVRQTGGAAYDFFGHGMRMVTQPVGGDFTATIRLDVCAGLNGEPVNQNSWIGLGAFEKPDGLNWNWEQRFYLVQTAGNGLRVAPDFGDGAGTRVSSYALPAGRPWLRIARQGNLWTAWTSADGRTWELGACQFRKTPDEMHVGLFFRGLAQESRAHFRAVVSELSIAREVVPDAKLPTPPVASGVDGDRLTGVVLSRSDPQVAVVRSTAGGLLRTVDGGATWRKANGSLQGSDLTVRSVAIHPRDPNVMIRACGVGGQDSRLWRTVDCGESWEQLDFKGDFDGIGPSALCGEVVGFDVYRPELVYVGTESRGFFRSTDSGKTWQELLLEGGRSLAGQRITSVAQWPWHEHHPAKGNQPRLCLTTSGDEWMTFLGRGPSSTATAEKTVSRIIFTREDQVDTLQIAHERSDTGIYNAMNDMAMVLLRGEMRFATTHGFQSEHSGNQMALYLEAKNLESLRPCTGMAAASFGVGNPWGRCITQALDPERPGRYSRSDAWAFEWNWLTPAGDRPQGGLIAASGDERNGKVWWFLHADGLYLSTDGGDSVRQVLDASGRELTP